VCLVLVIGVVRLDAQGLDTTYARPVREATSDPGSTRVGRDSRSPDDPVAARSLRHHHRCRGRDAPRRRAVRLLSRARRRHTRVRVETIGHTEEGREIVIVVVADEATMGRLDEYRALTARLADPRTLPGTDLEGVLAQAKPTYYLNGGLHSPEMGSPEMLTELAYRLAVSDEPAIRAIRERVITLINPASEPDGRDRQVDWYHRYTKQRTEWDDGFPRSSPYWGRYVFHDNNRDGIQISQELTKAVYREYFRWHPTVMPICTNRCRCSTSRPGRGPTSKRSIRSRSRNGSSWRITISRP
jgi:hypothetical protein